MNKLTYTSLLLLSSIVAFAQEARPTEGPGRFQYPDAEPMNAPPDGGQFVPIDNYQFLLLGLAVLLIAYFVWRSRQVQKA